jgi:hypothetical protein
VKPPPSPPVISNEDNCNPPVPSCLNPSPTEERPSTTTTASPTSPQTTAACDLVLEACNPNQQQPPSPPDVIISQNGQQNGERIVDETQSANATTAGTTRLSGGSANTTTTAQSQSANTTTAGTTGTIGGAAAPTGTVQCNPETSNTCTISSPLTTVENTGNYYPTSACNTSYRSCTTIDDKGVVFDTVRDYSPPIRNAALNPIQSYTVAFISNSPNALKEMANLSSGLSPVISAGLNVG